ncbi:uncharacterized protein Z520_06870 [Fonsecaea multimorphosa CBS 102226]|uniref:Aldehyde dehydrogenase domain-containing protein n=1 Tax=Fonsecaea multimorphosa CBS 102226 TaxID=1442371 RepID=A0A0D2KLD8_9EURO|nr:uncharacterized protein Z520_06870 [Fonsecaea multimorphosa CBS 102226]KIX97418.1 hypothetical protein Z520_06870 [Fonsecaea multimorphosa CBS 102226]OAL23385.1 hypothetical protein AYO22_06435 [Fonsecaea multimorphosa]
MATPNTLPLIIDNKPVQPAGSAVVTNASSKLKAHYVRYVSATPEDAVAAVESAQTAFRVWSQSLPRTRRTILQKTAALIREHASELVKLQVEETNCPQPWAAFNINIAALHLEEIAGRITTALTGDIPVVQTPGQIGYVYKRPLGVVLSIPPWNAAVFLATRAIDTPIAVGCAVVLKASEQSPNTHHFLAGLFHRAGLPAGVLNVIQTRREDAAAVTEALVSHRHIRKIEFIGSAGVGCRIGALAGKYLKPTLMELGGKAAALVLDDADLELAAQGCVHGAYMHNGQTCFSTERIIVNKTVVENFIPFLSDAASRFPIQEAISPTGANNTLRMLQDAVSKGANVLYGQVKLLSSTKLQPIILSGLTPDMEIHDNESFGPVLAVYTAENDEEAIELANSTKYGLSAGVYSRDIGRAIKVASRLEVGQTHINFPMGTGLDEATLAVGLSKGSGWAKQNGGYGLDEFLELRTITVTDPVEFAAGMAAMAQSSSAKGA